MTMRGDGMTMTWLQSIAVMVVQAAILVIALKLFMPEPQEARVINIYNEWGLVEMYRQELTAAGPPVIHYDAMPMPGGGP